MLSEYIEHLKKVSIAYLEAIIELLAQNRDKRIFIMGNGGSASTANHFASDLQHIDLKAISLCSNMAILTRLANDERYECIFTSQLVENNLAPHEIIVTISASGNSPNILNAAVCAKEVGAMSVGLIGFGGGELARFTDICIKLSSKNYGVIEGVHCCLTHIITESLSLRLKR